MKIYAPSAQAICIFRERTTRDAPVLHMFTAKASAFPGRTERTKGGPFFFPSPVCASGNSKAPPKTAGPGGSEPSAGSTQMQHTPVRTRRGITQLQERRDEKGRPLLSGTEGLQAAYPRGRGRQRGPCAKCPATQKLKSRPFILKASIKTSGIFNLKGTDKHDRQ